MRRQFHGIYIGPRNDLRGERAILMLEEHRVQDMVPAHGQVIARTVVAQFDNLETPYSHGWHQFQITDFKFEYEYLYEHGEEI